MQKACLGQRGYPEEGGGRGGSVINAGDYPQQPYRAGTITERRTSGTTQAGDVCGGHGFPPLCHIDPIIPSSRGLALLLPPASHPLPGI